jgi:LytR cell envelope-related transcriptional attenuator
MTTGAVFDDREGTPPAEGDGGGRGAHFAPGAPAHDPGSPAAGGADDLQPPRHRAALDPIAPHPRPASRRGRARARRRGGATVSTVVPGVIGAVETGASPYPPRALPPERIRRRRAALLAGMGALTAAGVVLAIAGLSTVRNSTAGRYGETLAPDDPGYQAHVVPTPTMAVLHRGTDGDLVGAFLLALEPGDDGGTVIGVPPSTIVPGAAGDEATIAEVYRDEGPDAAAQALGVIVTVAVGEHVEVDDTQWARLVDPVGPVEVTLDEPVGEWPAGPVALEPDAVGRFLAAQAGGDSDLDRLDRQELFWNAWLPLVGRGGADALPGEVDTGIGRFVRGIAQGAGSATALPVAREDDGDLVRFRPDAGRVRDLVSRTVPYPTSASPGARISVRLLNGTRDGDLTTRAARVLVAGGAEISVAGNAASLDVGETSLVYTGGDHERFALWLQAVLEGGRVEEAPAGQDGSVASDDEIDVTVILGDDAGDLIGR